MCVCVGGGGGGGQKKDIPLSVRKSSASIGSVSSLVHKTH